MGFLVTHPHLEASDCNDLLCHGLELYDANGLHLRHSPREIVLKCIAYA